MSTDLLVKLATIKLGFEAIGLVIGFVALIALLVAYIIIVLIDRYR